MLLQACKQLIKLIFPKMFELCCSKKKVENLANEENKIPSPKNFFHK